VRPDLVDPGYKQAQPMTGRNFGDLMRIGQTQDWPGYFGSPRLASKEFGDEWMSSVAKADAEYALKILNGLDERSVPQWTSISGLFPEFLFGTAFLWLLFALALLWLFRVAHATFHFSQWSQALRRRDQSTAKILLRRVLPLLLALVIAVLTLRALPILGYPLSLFKLAPDVNHALLLLACLTLLLAVAKLVVITVVFVRGKMVAN
jgi:hypothetical protein